MKLEIIFGVMSKFLLKSGYFCIMRLWILLEALWFG